MDSRLYPSQGVAWLAQLIGMRHPDTRAESSQTSAIIHNNILDSDHCWTYLRPLALPPFSMATRTNSNQSPLPIITCPVCGQRMRLSTIMPEDEYRERMTFVCDCGFDYRHANAVRAERGML